MVSLTFVVYISVTQRTVAAMRHKNLVVIAYENALLGEGISRYILTLTGVKSRLIPAGDREEIKSALACHPQILILALDEPSHRVDLEKLDPRTMVIDMRDAVEQVSTIPLESAGLARIVKAVQNLNGVRQHPISM